MTITSNLLNKSAEAPLTAKEIVSLTNYVEQLQRKKDTVAKLDAKILPLIQEETELKSDVIESAELQSPLDEHIAQMTFLLTISKQNVTPTVKTTELAVIANTSASLSTTVSSTQPTQVTPPFISDISPATS